MHPATNVSPSAHRSSSLLFLLFLLCAVALEIGLAYPLVSGDRTRLALLIGICALTPLVLLVLLLFPRRLLLVVPLLILVPVHFLSVFLFEWVFLAGFAAVLLADAANHRLVLRLSPIEVVFLLYLAWGFCAISQAEDLSVAVAGMKPPVMFFLAFWAGRRFLGPSFRSRLLVVYALVAIGAALETLVVIHVQGYSITLLSSHILKLTDLGWGRSNYVAAVCALTACAFLPVAIYGGGRRRIAGAVTLGAAAFVALATVSRGGTLALFLGTSLGLLFTFRKSFGWGILIAAGLFAAYLLSPIGQAGVSRFVKPEELPSIGHRFLMFREATRIALTHPIMGVGADQIPYHTFFFVDGNPHNIFLKNAADFGFVGLALYVILLGLLAGRLIHLLRRRNPSVSEKIQGLSFFLVLSVAVVNASYEPSLDASQYGFLFWFVVGTLFASGPAGESR